jgi:hypothetical protein
MLPLTRPALAALAVLQATWIYNDFLWALVLTQTTARRRRPVTTALANLSGEFFTDYNVVAAAAILTKPVALPGDRLAPLPHSSSPPKPPPRATRLRRGRLTIDWPLGLRQAGAWRR